MTEILILIFLSIFMFLFGMFFGATILYLNSKKWLHDFALTKCEEYRQAFKVACELLNGAFLFGYDTDKIFEIIMNEEGVVSSTSYEEFIFEHLDELRGLDKENK